MKVTKCDICGKISENSMDAKDMQVIHTYYVNENRVSGAIQTKKLDLCYECEEKAKSHLILAYAKEYQPHVYDFFDKDIKTLLGYDK